MKIVRKILVVFCVFIGLLFIISGAYLLQDKDKSKLEHQENIPINNKNNKTGSISCTRDTFEMPNYKIDYQYNFSFTNGKVEKVSTIYTYTFKTKESYDLFDINLSTMGPEAKKDFDSEKLTKTYITHIIDEEYASDSDQYLSYVQENGYICKEENNGN